MHASAGLFLFGAALSLEDNRRRPGRYILLQEMESRVFGGKVKSSLDKAFQLKARFGSRRWQDVLAEVSVRSRGRGYSCLLCMPCIC